jgi:hypothetical protein
MENEYFDDLAQVVPNFQAKDLELNNYKIY